MQSHKIKKRSNSNLIDCNAIVQNKKGRYLQFKIAMQSRKIKKGGNSNLIDCYAIAQNKKREVTAI